MTEQPGAVADIIMKMKSAFEIEDGIVKVKKNDLTAIRTLRPQRFVRESETFNNYSSEQKSLVVKGIDQKGANIEMLLSKYTTYGNLLSISQLNLIFCLFVALNSTKTTKSRKQKSLNTPKRLSILQIGVMKRWRI